MKKLSLTRETLTALTPQDAQDVGGGNLYTQTYCQPLTQAYSCGTCNTLHCGTSTCYTHVVSICHILE